MTDKRQRRREMMISGATQMQDRAVQVARMSDKELETALVEVDLTPTPDRLQQLRELAERLHEIGIPTTEIDLRGAARTLKGQPE